ncbi:hypothetical protein LNP24_19260 [Klebsiella pneumoniae subsp. pneumoniae]|nr:hypothetical protein [Klebsiella pneumoniae subsp. pneumoniae]
MNNAALERLSSITERVQARPAAAALEQAPGEERGLSLEGDDGGGREQSRSRHAQSAEKGAGACEDAGAGGQARRRSGRARQLGGGSEPAGGTEAGRAGGAQRVEEQEGSRVCLHLRPSQRHLNSASAQQKLAEALGVLYGTPVELTIVEDDNPAMRTPLEWRQAIYEEKLAQAREAIIADNNIQTLRRFFDADLDEESIRPI